MNGPTSTESSSLSLYTSGASSSLTTSATSAITLRMARHALGMRRRYLTPEPRAAALYIAPHALCPLQPLLHPPGGKRCTACCSAALCHRRSVCARLQSAAPRAHLRRVRRRCKTCRGCKSRAAARLIMSLTCFISPAEMSPRAFSRASRCNFWACGGLATAAQSGHAISRMTQPESHVQVKSRVKSPHAMCMSKLYGTLERCWGCLVQQCSSQCCVHCHTWHQLQ